MISRTVRRWLGMCLLVLVSLLPAIDTVCCPDGCADPGHAAGWQTLTSHSTDACGLCLNAVAETRAAPHVERVRRMTPFACDPIPELASFPPPAPDLPPRRA